MIDYPAYLDHIRRESARFRAVLTDCDPASRVPACPDWDAADLLWHLATTQLYWAKIVRHRPTPPDDIDEPEAQRPESYAELLESFDDFSHALATELERADPEDPAWHWSQDHRVATSYRRQAHEALIHRIDAEETAEASPAPIDAVLAADGVLETLDTIFGACPPWGSFTPDGTTLRVRFTDAEPSIKVALGRFTGTDPGSQEPVDEDDVNVVADDGAPVGLTLTGGAADLDTWLWHRGQGRDLTPGVDGDEELYRRFAAIISQPVT